MFSATCKNKIKVGRYENYLIFSKTLYIELIGKPDFNNVWEKNVVKCLGYTKGTDIFIFFALPANYVNKINDNVSFKRFNNLYKSKFVTQKMKQLRLKTTNSTSHRLLC